MDIIEGALESTLLSNNASVNGTPANVDIFNDPEDDAFKGNEVDKDWLNGDFDMDDEARSSSCKRILYETIDEHTRVWDVIILIPNLVFLAFLLYRYRTARQRLAATNAPVLKAFHNLVIFCTGMGVARCIIAIVTCNVNGHAAFNGQTTDKILWVLLRGSLLATEISVLVFALMSGHLDSAASIRRVVLVASTVSLVFSSVQMALEFGHPDPAFKLYGQAREGASLFGHGGRAFWATSSAAFAVVYAVVILLPLLPCRHWLMLPHKRSFYYYATFLLTLDVVQAIGCGMTESESNAVSNPGLCFVNMTTYIYFVAFAPIVYFTFMAQFFGSSFAQPTMLFSYKAQTDEMDEEIQSRPCHFTLQTTTNGQGQSGGLQNYEEDDLFGTSSTEQNPIIINGSLDLTNAAAVSGSNGVHTNGNI